MKQQQDVQKHETITVVPFEPKYTEAFRSINEQWISANFNMEASDYKALDQAEEYIIQPGGAILIATLNGEAVGTVALIKMDDPKYDFELAKMGVSPKAQGKGIGWLLGQAALQKAKELGAEWVYLESNTKLKAALYLYKKLGFSMSSGYCSPYARCDVQMEIKL